MTKNSLKHFWTTKPAPCDYLPEQMESKTTVDISGANAQSFANVLSRSGFRRSFHLCYIPTCQNCHACISVRVIVPEFCPNKKMNKILRLNSKTSVQFVPNIATTEQYALFKTYLTTRHSNSDMAMMNFEEFRAMVEDCPIECQLLEIRQEDSELIGVMIVDIFDDGLSAVYSFFKPTLSKNSLGSLMILKLIETAKNLDMPYIYLGYMIKGLSNMSYKKNFKPLEYYHQGQWEKFDEDCP